MARIASSMLTFVQERFMISLSAEMVNPCLKDVISRLAKAGGVFAAPIDSLRLFQVDDRCWPNRSLAAQCDGAHLRLHLDHRIYDVGASRADADSSCSMRPEESPSAKPAVRWQNVYLADVKLRQQTMSKKICPCGRRPPPRLICTTS